MFYVAVLNSAPISEQTFYGSDFVTTGYVSVNFNRGIGSGAFTTSRPLPPGYSSATTLTSGQWANNNFPSSSGNHWYSFNVTTGTRYYFWINDGYEGDGSKTADVYVDAYYENGDYAFDCDDNWNYPEQFVAEYTGKVYVLVKPYNAGTYAIVYSTSNIRP